MKVVLMHDWLTGFRGGERVLEVFCEMFPDAPLYTLLHDKGSVPASIENRTIHTSFLDKLPGIYKHYRKTLPLMPLAASMMKIQEEADLVLSSSHCVIKGVKKPSNATHVSYIHSPMRYIYDQFDAYFGPHAPWYQRLGMKFFRSYLTNWDLKSNTNVDYPIANAEFVRARIQNHYKIDSDVVHPFVDLEDFRARQQNFLKKDDFYIMVTAFAPNKRVDLAISTFKKLGLKLKIIGSGQEEQRLKEMAGPTIEFLGNVSREEVIDHFFRAKAMVFPGIEDFGITPLESLASGTPVIAFRKGGVLETLNDQVAVFFDQQNEFALSEAIRRFQQNERLMKREDMFKRAEDFSKETFRKSMVSAIEAAMSGKKI